MVKEKPDLSDRQVTSQSEQVLTYVLVTSLGWEATLSPLNSSHFCCPRCHVLLLLWCSPVFFLSLFFSPVTALVDWGIIFVFGVACWTSSAFAEFLACVSSTDSKEVSCTPLSSVCAVM